MENVEPSASGGTRVGHADNLYKIYRQQVEHENTLYGQRFVWYITIQAFLFASAALLVQARISATGPDYRFLIVGALAIVSILGIAVSGAIMAALAGTREVLTHIREKAWPALLEQYGSELADYPHVVGGTGYLKPLGFFRTGRIPTYFVACWLALLAVVAVQELFPSLRRFVETLIQSV